MCGRGTGLGPTCPQDDKGVTFTSAPLAADMELTGHPVADLWLSSSVEDGPVFGREPFGHRLEDPVALALGELGPVLAARVGIGEVAHLAGPPADERVLHPGPAPTLDTALAVLALLCAVRGRGLGDGTGQEALLSRLDYHKNRCRAFSVSPSACHSQ